MDSSVFVSSIEFLNNFKKVERLSLVSKNGRRETDPEHTWHLVVTLWMLSEKYEKKIDLSKAIKMALIHDLPEMIAGDVYAHSTEISKEQKKQNEIKAMEEIVSKLPTAFGNEIKSLWEEYEERTSEEAKFVWLVDKIMPRVMYRLTDGDLSDNLPSDDAHDEAQKLKIREMSPMFGGILDEIYGERD